MGYLPETQLLRLLRVIVEPAMLVFEGRDPPNHSNGKEPDQDF
jgi:hypothetical protein